MLDIRGLHLTYGGAVRALNGIDLRVAEGSVVAVLGSNGAGKTSMLRAISGNLRRHRGRITGRIEFAGAPLPSDPAECVRRGIVQVPEGRRILSSLTIEENLAVGGMAARSRRSRVAALEQVHGLFPLLADRRHESAGVLSGGEQQMLAIGRAMMAQPRLLMLDEPSLGLAPKAVEAVTATIEQIHDAGTSVLLIEQNPALALEFADHAYALELGRVAYDGPATDQSLMETVTRLYLGQRDRTSCVDRTTAETPTLAPWAG